MTCACIRCDTCKGLGNVCMDDPQASEGWDLETCPDCHGTGISEKCEECQEAELDDPLSYI